MREIRRLLPVLLLVVVSAAAGALLRDALPNRAPQVIVDAPKESVLQRQAATIEMLELEVRRLNARVAPTLEGRAGTAQGPTTPPPEPAPETRVHAPLAAAVPVPASTALGPSGETPGGVLDLIRHLAEADTRQLDTARVGDPERMARLFQRLAEGPHVRVADTHPEAPVVDGTTIVLDAGVYDYSAFSGTHRGTFPADVTFRGIGMDRTLLILHEVSSTGEARNLGFEDLTLDTRGHYLADVRGDEPISLRFDRTRVIGFDQTPGGAVLLAARHGAILARDSRFEGGFGNAPGTGSMFHVRGPFLVRFERCVFVGPFKSLYERSDRASYAWDSCRFEQLRPERRRDLEDTSGNVHFENCQVEYLRDGETPTARERTTLNPAWR